MKRRGGEDLDTFCRRWLEAHPEPTAGASMSAVEEVLALQRAHDDEPEPTALACWLTPAAICDARRDCVGCVAYAEWRAKVRAPFEVR